MNRSVFYSIALANATHTSAKLWMSAMNAQSAFAKIYFGLVIAIYTPNRVAMISFLD